MRKNYTFGILAVVLSVPMMLSGCASVTSGNQSINGLTQKKLSKEITKNKTTEAQVRKIFGDPANTLIRDNGNVEWDYILTKSKGSAMNYIPFHSKSENSKVEKLTILFNKKGIVTNYVFSNSNIGTKATGY